MYITNTDNKIIYTGFKNTELEHTSLIESSKSEMEPNIVNARALTSKETFEYALDIGQILQLGNVMSHSSGDYISRNRYNYGDLEILKTPKFLGGGGATMDISGIEGSLIFDLNDNNRIDYGGENLNIKSLFALDDNRDGVLDERDEYFDKLKIVFTDKNSENKMVELSSIVNFINLEDYIDEHKLKSYREKNLNNSGIQYIDPIYTHDKYNSSTVDSMIDKFANEDGWLEFNDDTAKFLANLAYKREDLDGNDYLQKVNTQGVAYKLDETGEHGVNFYNGKSAFLNSYYGNSYHHVDDLPGFSTYMKSGEENEVKFTTLDDVNAENLQFVQKDRFDNIYNEYHKLVDTNANQREFRKYEKEFERITNLDFSKENLEKVKTEVDKGNLTDTFKDMDSLVAIKKDGNGGYILKFDTDRTVQVDELYFNTDDFLRMEDGRRVSILFEEEVLEFDTNDDLVIDKQEMNFESFAYRDEGKLRTLKEAGVKLIELNKNTENIQFQLAFKDGLSKTVDTLYKVIDLSKQNRVSSVEELNAIINHPYQNRVEGNKETLHLA